MADHSGASWWGGCPKAPLVCSLSVQGELGRGGDGGYGMCVCRGEEVVRDFWEVALDTKVSRVMASAASLGRLFQSLIVLGRNEELL